MVIALKQKTLIPKDVEMLEASATRQCVISSSVHFFASTHPIDMKYTALLPTTALLFLLGCTHDAPTPEPLILPHVGISGVVSYGQGDCMPAIDLSKRSYSPYNGEVYFYRKAALDQLGNGDFAQLKAVSPHYPVRNGQLAAVPPPDTYVLMLDSLYSTEYVVTITAGQLVTHDFKFWKCTVY
jgi:hypothetical protein